MKDDELAARRQARDQGIGQVADAFGTRARVPLITTKEEEPPSVTGEGLWFSGADVREAAAKAGDGYWPVPGLIPPLTSLLFGDPKAGKSTVAFDIAWNVASGNLVMGHAESHQGDVLYVAAETGSPELWSWSREMWPDDEWPERLKVVPMEQYGRQKVSFIMNTWHQLAERPTLVILDTLGKVILGPAERQNDRGSVYLREYNAMERLTQWAGERRCAVMALHHTNQRKLEKGQHWSQMAGGTNGLIGATEDFQYLERQPGGGLVLHADGRSYPGEQEWVLHRAGRNIQLFDRVAVTKRVGSRIQEVADCAITHWPDVSIEQIVEATQLGRATVRQYCKRLVDQGVFERVGDGVFRIRIDDDGQA